MRALAARAARRSSSRRASPRRGTIPTPDRRARGCRRTCRACGSGNARCGARRARAGRRAGRRRPVCGRRRDARARRCVSVLPSIVSRVESGDLVDVDEMRGLGQPKRHDRHEALPAGEHAAVLRRHLGEDLHRLIERLRHMTNEGGGFHSCLHNAPHTSRVRVVRGASAAGDVSAECDNAASAAAYAIPSPALRAVPE